MLVIVRYCTSRRASYSGFETVVGSALLAALESWAGAVLMTDGNARVYPALSSSTKIQTETYEPVT